MQYNLPEQYEFVEVVGKGGGGTVIKAYDRELQKYVVLKKLHGGAGSVDRRVEVDLLKNLNHQYIPAVYGYKEFGGESYTVMDYIGGSSLGDKLKKGHIFTEKETIKYAIQLCEAVSYLHSRTPAVIHGDIKPDNVMLREDGDICLIDFNISGVSKDGKAYSTGYTPAYAAPEQKREYERIRAAMLNRTASAAPKGNVNTGSGSEATELLTDEVPADSRTTVLCTDEGTDPTVRTELISEDEMADPVGKAASVENRELIPIDVASDIYSIGATLFHMCTGITVDKFDRTRQRLDLHEGLLRVLNRSLNEDPSKRYRSVAEMLKVLKELHKGDRRYKAMVFRQNVARLFFFCLAIAGVILIERGYTQTLREADEKYESYLEVLRSSDLNAEFEEAFNNATSMKPDELEPYLQYEYRLFLADDYAGCVDFTEREIMNRPVLLTQEGSASAYYVLGNCYLELKDNESAINAFIQSINKDRSNADVYVDLAVAYAENGNVEKAEKALDSAVSLGIGNDKLSYAKGEIAVSAEDYDTAITCLVDCVGQTEDDYRKMRAFVLIDKAYTKKGLTEENVNARIEAMQQAKNEVSLENRFLILNQLAQAYIDGASLKPGAGYEEGAIDASAEIISLGLGNANTYSNIVILKQRIADHAGALEYAGLMEEKYPDNYITMKRRAFLEVELQSLKKDSERDYSTFLTYYNKANELYDGQKNKSDAEMLLLKQTYEQLVEGNWLN